MAGSGFKTFVPGERLASADVNGYLMEQTVPVFASTAARDAAITSPAAGMQCIVTGTKRRYTHTGSAWQVTGWYTSAGRVGFTIARVATQSISASTATDVQWDTETYDSDGWLAVPAATLTVPAGLGGVYPITARMALSSTPGATNSIDLIVNGGVAQSGPFNAFGNGVLTMVLPLATADTFKVVAYQTNGTLNMTGHLYGTWIAP